MTTLRHPHQLATAVLGLSLALAGCSATNAITTTEDYDASDGVGLELGEVELTNILVISAAQGSPGTVLGAMTNRGDSAAEVSIGLEGDLTVVDLPAGATVLLGPDDEAVDLDAVPAPPGALVTLQVDSDAGGATTLQVPVLDGTLPEYADLVP